MNNNIGGPQLPEKASQTHHYLIFVWGGVSADTHGPYPTLEARDQAALDIMGDDSEDHSIHTLDITTAPDGSIDVEAGDYPYGFFEEDADDEVLD